MSPTEPGWRPSAWQRAVHGVLSVVSPERARAARDSARYHSDPAYRAEVDRAWDDDVRDLRTRGYRHSRTEDNQTPFGNPAPRSGDAELLADLPRMRARCRELIRDDAVAKGCYRAWLKGVVGSGIEERSATMVPEKDRAIDQVWREIRDDLFPAENLSWHGVQRLLASRRFEDGEVWVKRSADEDSGLWFEAVEADRVRTPLDAGRAISAAGGQIREGIERDALGRIVRYWISRGHPGDVALPVVVLGTSPLVPTGLAMAEFEPVSVGDAYHLKAGHTRCGQSRGVPELHPVIQDLRELDLFVVATLKKAQIASCMTGFIRSPGDALSKMLPTQTKKWGKLLAQKLVPGGLIVLYPGEDIQFATPRVGSADVADFVKLNARRIGTALGMSWQYVLSDFSDSTYSSARQDSLEADQTWDSPRQELIRCLLWIRRAALEWQLLEGHPALLAAGVGADDLAAVTCIPPKKKWVDPQKEGQAEDIAMRIGLQCLRDAQAALGKDWEEVQDQRLLEELREIRRREELGLPPKAPAQTPAQGNAPPPPDDDDEPPEDDDDRSAAGKNGQARWLSLGNLLPSGKESAV